MHRIVRVVAVRQVLRDIQAPGGTPDCVLVEQVRDRVGKVRARPGRGVGSSRRDDMPEGEFVGDDEDDRSGSGQEPAQRARVPPQRLIGALAMGQPVAVRVLAEPVPVGLDRLAVEIASPDLIEAGFGKDRYGPAAQRDADCFPGAQLFRKKDELGNVSSIPLLNC
jgi:hypothetical protein